MPIVLDGTIGINNPAGSASAPSLSTAGDTNTGIFFPAADTIAFSEGGTESMRINSSGDVLVGGTTVYNSAANRGNIAVEGVSSSIFNFGINGTNGGYIFHNGTDMDIRNVKNGLMAFATNNTEAMRIDASANFMVGTTTANAAGGTTFNKSQNSNFVTMIQNSLVNGATFQSFRTNGAQYGFISVSGSTTTYSTSSDYRLKENIAPMVGALDTVQALKPVTYKWKTDGSNGEGFIAHELAEIVPACVTGKKDAVDEEGNPVYQGIDTSFLVATLTAAIQEQQAMIEELKAKVAALEAA